MSTFISTRKLRRYRMTKGISLAAVAVAAGINGANVSRIETGQQTARPATARAIAQALGLTLEAALDQGLFRFPRQR